MTLTRRSFLRGVAGAMAACAVGVRFPQASEVGDWEVEGPRTSLSSNMWIETYAQKVEDLVRQKGSRLRGAYRINNDTVWIECED